MHNAYCDADENSLDLRIHLKQHTTCAKVRGKRSRSYSYGYVVLARHKSSECSGALPDGSYKPGLVRCPTEIDLLPRTYSLLPTTKN